MKRLISCLAVLALSSAAHTASAAVHCWNLSSTQQGTYAQFKGRLSKEGRQGDYRLTGSMRYFAAPSADAIIVGSGFVKGGKLSLVVHLTADALSIPGGSRAVGTANVTLDAATLNGTYWTIGQQYYQSAVYDHYETGTLKKVACTN